MNRILSISPIRILSLLACCSCMVPMFWSYTLFGQDRERSGDIFSTRTDPRVWRPAMGDMGGHVASISVLLTKELEGLRPMNGDTLDAYFKAWAEKRGFYPSELSGFYDDCVAIYLEAWSHVREAVRDWES